MGAEQVAWNIWKAGQPSDAADTGERSAPVEAALGSGMGSRPPGACGHASGGGLMPPRPVCPPGTVPVATACAQRSGSSMQGVSSPEPSRFASVNSSPAARSPLNPRSQGTSVSQSDTIAAQTAAAHSAAAAAALAFNLRLGASRDSTPTMSPPDSSRSEWSSHAMAADSGGGGGVHSLPTTSGALSHLVSEERVRC